MQGFQLWRDGEFLLPSILLKKQLSLFCVSHAVFRNLARNVPPPPSAQFGWEILVYCICFDVLNIIINNCIIFL